MDLRHGARPFFVTVCDGDGSLLWWEWEVDPEDRTVTVPEEDIRQIQAILDTAGTIVLQNAKFDATSLAAVGITLPWDKVEDTLMSGHVLASNRPHDLTSMGLDYLGIDIEPYELRLKEETEKARRLCRSKLKTWRIAKKGDEEMPSAKEKTWKYDAWLPKTLARKLNLSLDDPWWRVLEEYANADSPITLALWKVHEEMLRKLDLWEIYRVRVENLPIKYGMERRGITISGERTRRLSLHHAEVAKKCEEICVSLSCGRLEELPKGMTNTLRSIILDDFGLKPSKWTDKGNPSLDQYVFEEWLNTLSREGGEWKFINALAHFRKRNNALNYISQYERFWLPIGEARDWYRLHVSLNPTGTDTLRCTCSNPNGQQISKQAMKELEEDVKGPSARYMFGPLPGREWWSLDAKNIEKRIPVYECGEEALIALFERPDDPPYFGSDHALVAHILFRKEFEECGDGEKFKKKYKDTLYQYTKNTNFSLQYNAQKNKVDATAHREGAFELIKNRLGKLEGLNQKYIELANRFGYVETLPDKSVNPRRGYPLMCFRSENGRVKPTLPLAYHVQGTAGWWMIKAEGRCQRQLDSWNSCLPSHQYFMILTVHDELLFDFPRRADPRVDPKNSNLPKIRKIQRLMEQGGDDIGIPTPVNVEYHPDNWGEGITF